MVVYFITTVQFTVYVRLLPIFNEAEVVWHCVSVCLFVGWVTQKVTDEFC